MTIDNSDKNTNNQ